MLCFLRFKRRHSYVDTLPFFIYYGVVVKVFKISHCSKTELAAFLTTRTSFGALKTASSTSSACKDAVPFAKITFVFYLYIQTQRIKMHVLLIIMFALFLSIFISCWFRQYHDLVVYWILGNLSWKLLLSCRHWWSVNAHFCLEIEFTPPICYEFEQQNLKWNFNNLLSWYSRSIQRMSSALSPVHLISYDHFILNRSLTSCTQRGDYSFFCSSMLQCS